MVDDEIDCVGSLGCFREEQEVWGRLYGAVWCYRWKELRSVEPRRS